MTTGWLRCQEAKQRAEEGPEAAIGFDKMGAG